MLCLADFFAEHIANHNGGHHTQLSLIHSKIFLYIIILYHGSTSPTARRPGASKTASRASGQVQSFHI